MKDIAQIAAAIIASVGASGAIIFALSSWLGKIWAKRIMIQDQANHDRQLTILRNDLQRENQESLNKLKTEFEIYRETFLQGHSDKIAIYRKVADIIADLLVDMNIALGSGTQLPVEAVMNFERQRLRITGYLGMLAPQNVMDAYDNLVDYLLGIIEGKSQFDWNEVRKHAINMLNQVREDIGIDPRPIGYRGER
jgi:hypothetical protein